jgi:hypothetical protein
MGWAGRKIRNGWVRKEHKFWVENLKERDHLEEQDADGRIFKKDFRGC